MSASVLVPGDNVLAIRCRALTPELATQRRPRARWRTRLVADNNLRWFRTMLLGRIPSFSPAAGCRRAVAADHAGAAERRRRRGPPAPSAARRRRRRPGGHGPAPGPRWRAPDGDRGRPRRPRRPDDGDARIAHARRSRRGPDRGQRGGPGRGRRRAGGRTPTVSLPSTTFAWRSRDRRAARPSRAAGSDSGRWPRARVADHDVDRDGLFVHVNGVPVFARGALWTPLDIVGLAPSAAEIREALEVVRSAGMNMVRLPGVRTVRAGRVPRRSATSSASSSGRTWRS